MYARPPQHTQHAQQHVAHPHALYQQQQSSPYVSAATVPSHYVQSHQVGMVAGQASAANTHPQLPQLHAYPHLQLQYTYPSPLQTSHQPPAVQTHPVYVQQAAHTQQGQLQQQQQAQSQQGYRAVPAPQQQHAQIFTQTGHLQPRAQAYRPGTLAVAGRPPRAPSPLAHQVQTAQNGQHHYVQQAQVVQQSQAVVTPRPPNAQTRSTPQRAPSLVQIPISQPQPQVQPTQPTAQQAQQQQIHQPPAPPVPRQSSYNTRTRSASARATSVTVNGVPVSAATESSMPPPSRGGSPAGPSPAVVEVEPPLASRVNSQSANDDAVPEATAEDAELANGTAVGAGEAPTSAQPEATVQVPPMFPYYGKEVVPVYLPSQEPIGIGLGYGLPEAYGGFGVAVGGGYFEDVKGGMDGWLDHEGYNTDPLLQPGSAVDALSFFRESLSGMVGGTMAEWSDFVGEHFDEGARLQISLSSASSVLKLYDLPSTSLARFFSSFPPSLRSTTLDLHPQTESPLWSPPQSPTTEMPYNALPRHGVKVESEGEWRWSYAVPSAAGAGAGSPRPARSVRETKEVVWKIRLQATFVPVLHEGVLKMENLEVLVDEWALSSRRAFDHERVTRTAPVPVRGGSVIGEWGLPGKVMRVLDILEGMEEMLGVVEAAQGMAPRDALRELTVVRSHKDSGTPLTRSPADAAARIGDTALMGAADAVAKRSPVKYNSPLKVLSDVKVLSPIKASPEKEAESVGEVIEVEPDTATDTARDVAMA